MLSYCQNNPITYADSTGMCAHTLYAPWMGDCSDCITYDVPLYEQGTLNLCWAFCQVMIEQFYSTQYPKISQVAAIVRAVSLAMASTRNTGDWNKPGIPKNCITYRFSDEPMFYTVTNEFFSIDLAQKLQTFGPLYAYYSKENGDGAHMVVVTGVNLKDDIVYTNNPWGKRGEQSFADFMNGFVGNGGDNYQLAYLVFPRA